MTRGFVADASIGVAWGIASQSSEGSEELLDEVASGTPFFVPVLWTFEIANVLLVLTRRKRIKPEEGARARQALSRLSPVIDDEGQWAALGRISDLAAEHGLSAYDAAYLELALRRKVPLASRDSNLKNAARRCGVKILP